ncbi:MAG: hypothetical protein WAL87_07150 [Chthoniobacterales bacterium]
MIKPPSPAPFARHPRRLIQLFSFSNFRFSNFPISNFLISHFLISHFSFLQGQRHPIFLHAAEIGSGENTLSNLLANNPGDATWQYLHMDLAYTPGRRFGIGTVTNNGLSPNGDIDPNGVLYEKYLVQNRESFNFTGVN